MKKYYSIEILRFLTAISILIFHYQHFFLPYNSFSDIKVLENIAIQPFYTFLEFFYKFGNSGVPMFWTISGFVFAHIYLNQKKDIKRYFINRFSRLYPLHLITLLIVAGLQILNNFFFNKFQIYQINDFYHFILNLLFISSWGLEKGYSFNYPIWSVSVEIAVYFFFYLTIEKIKKYNFKFLILISVILLIIDQLNYNFFFSKCARLFFYGVIIYKISLIRISSKKFISISIFLIFLSLKTGLKTFLLYPSILLLFVSLEIYFCKIKNLTIFLGNQTYSLYLIHVPVQLIIIFLIKFFSINNNLLLSGYFFISYIFFMIIMSYIIFEIFEKPTNNYLRNYFLK